MRTSRTCDYLCKCIGIMTSTSNLCNASRAMRTSRQAERNRACGLDADITDMRLPVNKCNWKRDQHKCELCNASRVMRTSRQAERKNSACRLDADITDMRLPVCMCNSNNTGTRNIEQTETHARAVRHTAGTTQTCMLATLPVRHTACATHRSHWMQPCRCGAARGGHDAIQHDSDECDAAHQQGANASESSESAS